jgi:hypothetical protein
MATDRQIEANRRNAQKSTGPRSASGKNLSSKNSYKHGLSTQTSIQTVEVETLAAQIAGPAKDRKVLELARAIAEADIRLKEIGHWKIAIIESAKMVGIDPTAAQGHDCKVSEAICNQLPNLVRLFRYENREGGRRDRAIRKLIRMAHPVVCV